MLKFSNYLKDLRAVTLINAMNGGFVLLYDGFQPQTGANISSQQLIARLNLGNPCAVASNGVITFNPTNSVRIANDATITWARMIDANNQFLMDLSCGDMASQADLVFVDNQVKQDGTINIGSAQISEGN
jgi:hypothetical protein